MPYGPEHPNSGKLRSAIKDKIKAGELPVLAPAHLYAGYGEGQRCSVCGEAVSRTQVLYEVPVDKRGTLHFHLACHAAWQLECTHERGP